MITGRVHKGHLSARSRHRQRLAVAAHGEKGYRQSRECDKRRGWSFVVSRNTVSSTLFRGEGWGAHGDRDHRSGQRRRGTREAWKRAGHSIILGLREAGKHSELIRRTGARALSPADAAQKAEVVVLALPYAAVEPAVGDLGPLAGKVLIDATNPVTPTDHGPDLALGFTDSAAEALARQVPQARWSRR